MTIKTYEITESECDACGRIDKSKGEKPFTRFSYTITTITDNSWYLNKPLPQAVRLDLCHDCKESFDEWKSSRSIPHICGCNGK